MNWLFLSALPPKRLAVLLVALLAVLFASATAFIVVVDRRHSLAALADAAQASSRLLEEHALRSFETVDVVLQNVKGRVEAKGVENFRSEADWQVVRDAAAQLPEFGVVFVYDRDGTTVQGSPRFPAPQTNVFDREYFQAARGGLKGMHVGHTIKGRTIPKLFFTLARRLERPDGEFMGVVHAGIQVDYFIRLCSLLDTASGASCGIVRRDGAVIVRYPASEQDVGASVVGTALYQSALATGNGSLSWVSPFDGVERHVAYRYLEPLGIYVAAALPVEAALADWRKRSALVAALSLGGLLLSAGLALLLLRALQRQDQAMAALDTARRESERANRAKSRFLAAVCHDLRQPVTALRLYLDLIGPDMEGRKGERYVGKAARALGSCEAMVGSLLEAARLEAGQVTATPVPFELGPLVANIASDAGVVAEAKGIALQVVPTRARVYTDPQLLERILRNLVSNALRYTDTGGVLIGTRRCGGFLRIEVWDSGCGMPPDALAHIWEEFYRASQEQGGLGLGLSIVRRLAVLMKCPLGVRSREGRGSVFSVTVPLAETALPAPTSVAELEPACS